jgi:Chaperone of endosialidase
MEDSMKPLARFAAMLTGLVLLLNITPSWGQTPVCDSPGCNPTESDANDNTAGGTSALNGVTSGTNNTAFGRAAMLATSSGNDNTAVGTRALLFNGIGFTGHRPDGGQSEKLFQLQPVTFAYKDDTHGATHYGLIAEQVAMVYPELVTRTSTGEVQTVKYQELISMLLNELQRQQQAINRQERELAEMSVLRKEMAELRALVGQGREMAASSR